MNYNHQHINQILDKYWDGNCTLEEEHLLRDYFNSEQVDKSHVTYSPLFAYFDKAAADSSPIQVQKPWEITSPSTSKVIDLKERKKSRSISLTRWRAAASFALLLGVGMFFFSQYYRSNQPKFVMKKGQQEVVLNKDEALKEMQNALMKVSVNLNKGIEASQIQLRKPYKTINKQNKFFKL